MKKRLAVVNIGYFSHQKFGQKMGEKEESLCIRRTGHFCFVQLLFQVEENLRLVDIIYLNLAKVQGKIDRRILLHKVRKIENLWKNCLAAELQLINHRGHMPKSMSSCLSCSATPGNHTSLVSMQVPFQCQVTPSKRHRLAAAVNSGVVPLAFSMLGYSFRRQPKKQNQLSTSVPHTAIKKQLTDYAGNGPRIDLTKQSLI